MQMSQRRCDARQRPWRGQGARSLTTVRDTGWMADFVTVETDGAVATIRLARPPMNALNAQVQDEIAAAAEQAIDDGLDVDLPTGLEIERLHFAGLFTTEDQRTGMRSFMENGPGKAAFAGR
jgi:enoyl-CoA hydratase/carnithine racemase